MQWKVSLTRPSIFFISSRISWYLCRHSNFVISPLSQQARGIAPCARTLRGSIEFLRVKDIWRYDAEIGIRLRFLCAFVLSRVHLRAFTCASSCARTRTGKCSANDGWGMHLGCNCDSEVACFPKGCLFSLPLCHLHPSVPRASSLFGSFLAVHRGNLWTIRSERERTGRAGSINRCS